MFSESDWQPWRVGSFRKRVEWIAPSTSELTRPVTADLKCRPQNSSYCLRLGRPGFRLLNDPGVERRLFVGIQPQPDSLPDAGLRASAASFLAIQYSNRSKAGTLPRLSPPNAFLGRRRRMAAGQLNRSESEGQSASFDTGLRQVQPLLRMSGEGASRRQVLGAALAIPFLPARHCEDRSDEAIQPLPDSRGGLLRSARNDDRAWNRALSAYRAAEAGVDEAGRDCSALRPDSGQASRAEVFAAEEAFGDRLEQLYGLLRGLLAVPASFETGSRQARSLLRMSGGSGRCWSRSSWPSSMRSRRCARPSPASRRSARTCGGSRPSRRRLRDVSPVDL